MAKAALDLNDAEIVLVADGAILRQDGAAAALADGHVVFGAEAARLARLRPLEASSRHWRDLDDAPLVRPLGACRSSADVVHAHLQSLAAALPAGCDGVVAAVPSYWSPQQLGLLLGLAAEAGMPLVGLVDASVAAARRPYPGRQIWQLELTLQDVALTSIVQSGPSAQDGTGASDAQDAQDAQAAAGLSQRHAWLSQRALDKACARAIARAFLRGSRFDPLHDAETDQELHARLPEWLTALRGDAPREVALQFRGNEFRATLVPGDVRAAVATALEPLLQALRVLCPADGNAVLQIPERLAACPGALETLLRAPGWEIVALEPAAAAFGALRARGFDDSHGERGAVRLTTRLPWDRPPDMPAPAGAAGSATGGGVRAHANGPARPTHVAYRGRIYRLGATPLQIGSAPGEGEFALPLPASVQAVSRRHCSVLVEGSQVRVHDHSRYGTRLNGHRIEGSAVLHVGDVLQVGEPPIELALLTEVADGAPA